MSETRGAVARRGEAREGEGEHMKDGTGKVKTLTPQSKMRKRAFLFDGKSLTSLSREKLFDVYVGRIPLKSMSRMLIWLLVVEIETSSTRIVRSEKILVALDKDGFARQDLNLYDIQETLENVIEWDKTDIQVRRFLNMRKTPPHTFLIESKLKLRER